MLTEVKSQAVRLAVSGLFKKTKGSEKDVNVLDCVLCLCGDNDTHDTLSTGKFFSILKKMDKSINYIIFFMC